MLIFLALLLLTGFFYLKFVFTYWQRKKFPFIKPVIPFGNLKPFAKKQRSFGLVVTDLYNETTEPVVGIYNSIWPGLLVRDPELVKMILKTNFDSFHDRGLYNNTKRQPVGSSLFNISGQEWHHRRQKLTPLFSSSKLRGMFQTLLIEADKFEDYLLKHEGAVFEWRNLFHRFLLNVVSSVFFGVDINCIDDPNHQFIQVHQKFNNPDFLNSLRFAIVFLMPKLIDLLRIPLLRQDIKNFFLDLVGSTIEDRKRNNYRRNDFIQSAIDLMEEDERTSPGHEDNLTVEKIAGEALVFYMAGIESTAGASSYCLYELTRNPRVYEKVQKEIDDMLVKCNGGATYDAIQEMKYLDWVVKETMRKNPGIPMLNRVCTKDFKIPDSPLTITKGTPIVISVIGMHLDPLLFAKPDEFIPERFETFKETHGNSCIYLPFGDGPHACVAVRMGFVMVKLALVKVLSKFRVESADDRKMEYSEFAVPLVPKYGINLRIRSRGSDKPR